MPGVIPQSQSHRARVLIGMLLAIAFISLSNAQAKTRYSVLDSWKASTQQFSTARFMVDSVVTEQFSRRGRATSHDQNEMLADWRSDGDRLLILKTLNQLSRSDGQRPLKGLRTATILEGSIFARYTPGLGVEVATASPTRQHFLSVWKTDELSGGFLDGRLFAGDAGPVSVIDVLSDPNAKVSISDSDGMRQFTAEAPEFTLYCAFDAATNHVCRFGLSQKRPGKRYRTFKSRVEDIRYDRVNGIEYIASALLRVEYQLNEQGIPDVPVLPNYDQMSYEVSSKRSNVNFDFHFPDTQANLLSRIENGTPAVRLEDIGSPIQYVWNDGKAEPTVNRDAAERMKREATERGPASDPFSDRAAGILGWARSPFFAPLAATLGVLVAWWIFAKWRRHRALKR